MFTRSVFIAVAFSALLMAQQKPTGNPGDYNGAVTSQKPTPHSTQKSEQQVLLNQQQNGDKQQQQGGLLGIISDAKCGRAHTVAAGMGPAGCARYCVDNKGSSYILVTKDRVVPLSGNKQILENYAGESVMITGGTNIQNANQIHASYTPGLMTPSDPPKQ